jgi:hypothetical protein
VLKEITTAAINREIVERRPCIEYLSKEVCLEKSGGGFGADVGAMNGSPPDIGVKDGDCTGLPPSNSLISVAESIYLDDLFLHVESSTRYL